MRRSISLSAACGLLVAACATPEHQDRFFFGEATERNIELHSERPTDLSNSKAVNGESGKRAADAVKRLRDGQAAGS